MSQVKLETGKKGIILAGGTGSRLHPLTLVVSKQLMPVYDKPMIYYPLATLMQAGIREILIITAPEFQQQFKQLLGDGSSFGIAIEYIVQDSPDGLAQAFILAEDFLAGSGAALVLGDNVFYGHNLVQVLQEAALKSRGGTVFGYHVANPSSYGVIEFDEEGKALSLEEKPVAPKSNFAVPGLYFFDERVVEFAKQVKPSLRGELEIVDVIRQYMQLEELHVVPLGRGTAWFDTGTHDDLLAAAQFIQSIDKRQGLKINCPEEVAYLQQWINKDQIKKIAKGLMKGSYGPYLLSLVEGD